MTRSTIDPVSRIEGHLRVEMEVEDGVVTDAWVSGGCFRGMELVVEDRTPADAVQIVQRICGVCPISHAESSAISAEKALGITIPTNARLIRNLLEGSQFLHSHILWFYNLAALDYVNPLNALSADPSAAAALATDVMNTSMNSDLVALRDRLEKFANNGQLSIFSGNWFPTEEQYANGTNAYVLPAEADLVLTAHYLEALQMQAKASEISAILGGKMPHIMTCTPGGTMFVPTEEKLDNLLYLIRELRSWVESTVLQDTIALAPYYSAALDWGGNAGRYIAWGVFENATMEMADRYLPSGVVTLDGESLSLEEVEESLITEYTGHSWYQGSETYTSPYFTTEPEFTEYNVDDRYTWVKCPAYNGQPHEAGGLSRILAAYSRGVSSVVEQVDSMLSTLNLPLSALNSTLGRTAVRQIETVYIAQLMEEWCLELMEAIAGGESSYFAEPATDTGSGTGFWEAPRGALYHSQRIVNGKIDGYQIIIPSTWNLAPHNADGVYGPMEESLIGVPVDDMEKPINALRTVHSFDPCTACAVHVTEPKTGKKFTTITSPWGVK